MSTTLTIKGQVTIPKPALFLAGKAFVQYRRRGGSRNNVLWPISSSALMRP